MKGFSALIGIVIFNVLFYVKEVPRLLVITG